MNSKLVITVLLLSILILLVSFTQKNERNTDLPNGYNTLFSASGECLLCHNSMEDAAGTPMGILNDWRSTMMGNAAKDPYWRAKLSHELAVNPGIQSAIEDKCTRCHAPAANWDAHYNGQSAYTLSQLDNDPIARDGVNCTVCHQIPDSSLGSISGNFMINDQSKIYGPFENPFSNPMFNHTGYTATHSDHINDSRVCGSCHSLITHGVDQSGTPTGNSFVEQAIYHEWLNSSYSQNGTSCQECHMPRIDDPTVISSMPPWFDDSRSPFGKHHLVGGNVFMLKLLKQFITELGITATEANFDSTINRTYEMLQERTLSLELTEEERTNDTLYIDVSLTNMTGHKFPAGFPSRRAFIELIAVSNNGDTLFHSGAFNSEFDLLEENAGIEPHYNMINNHEQVQIYEMIMGDNLGNPTTVLLYADDQLKDNRLTPLGFKNSHNAYDTVKIVGSASSDPDFNHLNGMEGSGCDIVHYHIPLNAYSEDLNVDVKVHYQTTNNKWLSEMFSHSTSEIDSFKHYYNEADKTPAIVAEASLVSTSTGIESPMSDLSLVLYPNPVKDLLQIRSNQPIASFRLFNSNGSLISSRKLMVNSTIYSFNSDNAEKGVYYVEIETAGKLHRRKVVVI